jgi:hypothetical protein
MGDDYKPTELDVDARKSVTFDLRSPQKEVKTMKGDDLD